MHRLVAVAFVLGLVAAGGAPALAQVEDGERLFRQRTCVACHTVNATAARRVGPSLFGIFGRKTGNDEGFPRYTPANKNANLTWDRETLDKYLTNPKAVIPGTNMNFNGVPRAEERKALIDYLESLK
jgi:cytochrome c